MKFSTTLIALVAAGLANAQLSDIPSCSLSCFVTALTSDGCSSLTDFACHCQKPSLVSDITPCVQKACSVGDQISVSNAVVAQCSSAGHPISVPPVETTTSASSSASSSASATDSSSSASATATDTGSSSASSSASATATGSSSSSAAGSSSAGSTPAGTSTPLPSKTTGGSSGATTSPVWTGAAVNVKGNMAGVAAVAAAAAYIL
ncbi:GPI-anchored CFEM domain protein B [Penicillium cataractarum]|uniref:GPI-anchored CFEM domain protein B n=1 Tax=Penicillium cataractarum TaxID=2100454 RepID=A0A9W9V9N3_9EURO|nr:GPI-anchored CFEM domain protein B [Penicillium cataractarum]KAJ5371381.1 GPI-anchored CFEM domain protein B [Penicillium cataractarum]